MPLALILAIKVLAERHGYKVPEEILHEHAVRNMPWWLRKD